MRRRDEEDELGLRVAVAPPLAIIFWAGDCDEVSVVDQVQERRVRVRIRIRIRIRVRVRVWVRVKTKVGVKVKVLWVTVIR